MTYPEGLPPEAFCAMEGCNFERSSVCPRCKTHLRCQCGCFAGHGDAWWKAHYKRCPWAFAEQEWERRDIESG